MADQPWHDLPPRIAHVLRPLLTEVAEEIIEAVRTVPAYARPLEGEFGEGVRAGVEGALRHFLAEIETGGRAGSVPRDDVYVALGRGEMRAGRSLESLLSAYRVGARVAWRSFAAAGVKAGLEPDTLYLLAESIFAYIDMLSAESAEGHALEQSAAASEADLRRRRLVRMLVREPPLDIATIEAAASEAGWQLPRSLAVVAIAGGRRRAGLATAAVRRDRRRDRRAVGGGRTRPGWAGAPRRARASASQMPGASAGLGTTVEPHEAAVSFGRARAALALAHDGQGCRWLATAPASCCCAAISGSHPSSRTTGWRHSRSCRPDRVRA